MLFSSHTTTPSPRTRASVLPRKASTQQFVQNHYPQTKRRLLSLLDQLLQIDDQENGGARDKSTDALHAIVDKAPLLAYRIVRDILVR